MSPRDSERGGDLPEVTQHSGSSQPFLVLARVGHEGPWRKGPYVLFLDLSAARKGIAHLLPGSMGEPGLGPSRMQFLSLRDNRTA
jgi:hypothetical protein